MTHGWWFGLALAAALGCGLAAGVFFAFSSFVMKSLARLPVPHAIAAMQSINVAAVTPMFMIALFATAALCAVLSVAVLAARPAPGSVWLLSGSLLYLAGTILVTIVCHVPRNHALAAVQAASPESSAAWKRYLAGWTLWNHVRTVSALAAAALLTIGLTDR